MILIFDYFETLLNTKSMDFNRCLYEFWKDYYQDKCPFEAMKKYGEDLFQVLMEKHKNGEEYPFVKEELPLYAQKFGGDKVDMNAEDRSDENGWATYNCTSASQLSKILEDEYEY